MNKTLMEKIKGGREYRDFMETFRAIEEEPRDEEEPEEESKDEEEPKDEGRMIVEGHAATFNEPYTLYADDEFQIDEQIDPAAFADTEMDDVIMQYNHEGRVFARTRNRTLSISTDDKGLLVQADLGGTEEGRRLYEEIKGGYTDRMSFGFTVREDNIDEEEPDANGVTRILRTITKVGRLYDVSPVSLPANDGTDISARGFCDGEIARIKAERLQAQTQLEKEKAKAIALLNL